MSNLSEYIRGINAAATIVAGQDTGDLSPDEVAGIVGDLAAALYEVQVAFIKDNNLAESDERPTRGRSSGTRSKKRSSTSKRSSGGSKSSSKGMSPAQRMFATDLIDVIEEAGEEPVYTFEDLEGLKGKAISDAIGELVEQRDDLDLD